MKIAKFISICIFIAFCSCNNKGVYENCISFKLTDFLDKGEIKGTLEMALENFFIYNKYNHLTAYYGYQMHKDHSYLLIVKKTSYFQILYHQQQ